MHMTKKSKDKNRKRMEKRKALSRLLRVMCICLLLTGHVTTIQADEESQTDKPSAGRFEELAQFSLQEGVTEKKTGFATDGTDLYYLVDGEPQKEIWKKYEGKKWYFSASGKAVRDRSEKIGAERWVFDENGVLSEGKDIHVLKILRSDKIVRYLVSPKGKAFPKGWQIYKKKKVWIDKKGRLTAGIKKIKGHYYGFTAKGFLFEKRENHILTVDGTDYLILSTGEAGKGWCEIGKRYCYCKADGRILKDTTKNGIRINKKGFAKTRPMTALEERSAKIVASITTEGMSTAQKIAACWNYITSHSRFTYRSQYDPAAYTQSEFRRLALLMLNINGGNCYGFAAGFAALTKAAGCKSYVIYGLCPGTRDRRPDGLTRHGWVYISGYGYFDPEGKYAGFADIYASGSCPWIAQGMFEI